MPENGRMELLVINCLKGTKTLGAKKKEENTNLSTFFSII
jgi:hypothetical protein